MKPEEMLSKQICELLDKCHVYYFHPANEGKRGFGAIRSFHNNGGRAGVADLVLLLPFARCVFVELKADKNKQRKSQIEFENNVRSLGFEYYVWRNVDDAVVFCNQLIKEAYCGSKIAGLF